MLKQHFFSAVFSSLSETSVHNFFSSSSNITHKKKLSRNPLRTASYFCSQLWKMAQRQRCSRDARDSGCAHFIKGKDKGIYKTRVARILYGMIAIFLPPSSSSFLHLKSFPFFVELIACNYLFSARLIFIKVVKMKMAGSYELEKIIIYYIPHVVAEMGYNRPNRVPSALKHRLLPFSHMPWNQLLPELVFLCTWEIRTNWVSWKCPIRLGTLFILFSERITQYHLCLQQLQFSHKCLRFNTN